MILSDTEGQAVNFLGNLKREFLDNEHLIALFGVKCLTKDRETEFIVQFNDGHEARLIAKGAEQKLRGIIWKGKRPNLIIGDDLENDEMVMNDERRLKFREWFNKTLIPVGSKYCIIRIVGTILHLDSLLERMMPELGNPNSVEEGLKQYSIAPKTWLSYRYKAHNEDYSQILWPEQFDEQRLREIRTLYVEQGFPEGYSQEYLNYPVDEATAYFRKGDFEPIQDYREHEEKYLAIDLAISQKDYAAYTVFVVAGLNSIGMLKIRDVKRFRGDALEIIDTLFDLYIKHKPQLIFIEEENIARTLGAVISKEMQERDIYLPLQMMTASQDKIKRARALQSRMRQGRVEFDFQAPWFPSYQQEFLQFPRGAYMDQVDATSWIALGLDKIYDAPTKKELEWMLFEENKELTTQDTWGSANSITGY